MPKYVALLRGINLGKRQIKMEALRKAFEGWGFQDVSTLLASGNVIFEAAGSSAKAPTPKIEAGLKETFGFEVPVILRSSDEIAKLVRSDPFKNVKVTPETRLFVTFLAAKSKSKLPIPYKLQAGDYVILDVENKDVISVLTLTPLALDSRRLSPGSDRSITRTPDAMDILGKAFGKNITTRNWNTVLKIAEALDS